MSSSAEGLKRKNDELERSHQDLERVLELLEGAPEDDALAVFRNLRRGASVTEVLQLADSGRLTTASLSVNRTARAFSVPTRSDLEFVLNVRHPNAFPGLLPLEVASIDLRLLSIGNKVAPLSQDPETNYSASTSSAFQYPLDQSTAPHPMSTVHESRYIDGRLDRIPLEYWTSVPVSSTFAAQTISFYLVNEHPVLGIFDPELFVRDLIHCRRRFCTPLLVSSLLAWSCVSRSFCISYMINS
jgi:hypothetical protein